MNRLSKKVLLTFTGYVFTLFFSSNFLEARKVADSVNSIRQKTNAIAEKAKQAGRKGRRQTTTPGSSTPSPLYKLFTAIESGDKAKVEEMIAKDSSLVDKTNGDLGGETPLMHAAIAFGYYYGDNSVPVSDETRLAILLFLIEKSNNVSATDSNGFTTLHIAARYGLMPAVKKLVEKGAKVNATTKDSYGSETPLILATLCWGKKDSQKELIKFLVENGADVNFATEYFNPLGAVILGLNDLEMVEYFLSKGARVDSKTNDGSTPLHFACGSSGPSTLIDSRIVDLLISKGADVSAKNNDGLTPLMIACMISNLPAAQRLATKGADLNAVGNEGQTALMYAVMGWGGDPKDLVQLLIDNKVNLNAKTKDGETALSLAKQNDRTKIAEMLKGAGATE